MKEGFPIAASASWITMRPVVNAPTGEALYTLEVEVTHYCACAKCCGSNAQGLTASGKQAAVGMVAMSSHYPFGTQIMINGTMYTVEDRGGSGIENNIHRVVTMCRTISRRCGWDGIPQPQQFTD